MESKGKMSRRNITQINRLGILARQIRSEYEQLELMLTATRRKCNEVVAEAILLGEKLKEAKQIVGHGNWIEWLAENCPQISENTARNYMRLTNPQHVVDLRNSMSLRQAYLQVGIIKDEDEIPQPTPLHIAAPQDTPQPQPAATVNLHFDDERPHPREFLTPQQGEVIVPIKLSPTPTTPLEYLEIVVKKTLSLLRSIEPRQRRKAALKLKPIVIFYKRYAKQ